ncbi:decapping endonuclease targeting mRNA [Dipsacomyces acuminosporus]|nr:decapping endonuclease targeting mRNA [Dipsacomyces acuminosporus]
MLTRVNIHPLSRYRIRCPQFTEPKEIVSFSYNQARQVCMDDRELKYYYPPCLDPAPCLFDGFEKQIRRDISVNEHIDGLLTALLHLGKNSNAAANDTGADFVMYRGMLTRIFVTPYSTRDSWAMNATRVGNTIYIEDDLTPEAIANRVGSSEQHQRLMYSGYRFETLCVVDKPPNKLQGSSDPDISARADAVVDTHTEYCSVFRTRLGNHSIVSGAEVDCIDMEKPSETIV